MISSWKKIYHDDTYMGHPVYLIKLANYDANSVQNSQASEFTLQSFDTRFKYNWIIRWKRLIHSINENSETMMIDKRLCCAFRASLDNDILMYVYNIFTSALRTMYSWKYCIIWMKRRKKKLSYKTSTHSLSLSLSLSFSWRYKNYGRNLLARECS